MSKTLNVHYKKMSR